MSKRFKKGVLGLDPSLEKREKQAYEKVQKIIEKKDAKSLDKWVDNFSKGKDWL